MISDEKSPVNLIERDLYSVSLFLLLSTPSLALAFHNLRHLAVNFFKFILVRICWVLECVDSCFSLNLGIFQPLFLQIVFPPLSCLSWDSHYAVGMLHGISHGPLSLFSFFYFAFVPVYIISTDLSLTSPIFHQYRPAGESF